MASAASALGSPRAIAALVYARQRDPFAGGYKPPTTRDIPQVKLPRIEHADGALLEEFLRAGEREESAEPTVPPLDDVPKVFFDADFELDNPRVFDAVLSEDSTRSQEKLSYYVDVVEAHLEREVANSSSQFFAAAERFAQIEQDAVATSASISEFAEQARACGTVAEHLRETHALQAQLAEADALVDALSTVVTLREKTYLLEAAAAACDEARDAATLAQLAAAHADAAAFAADHAYVHQLTVAQRLVDTLSAGEVRVRTLSAAVYARLLARDAAPAELGDVPAICASSGALPQAAELYTAEIDEQCKQIVKNNLPTADSLESQALAKSLHAMSPESAERMCAKMLGDLLALLTRVASCVRANDLPNVLDAAVRGVDSRVARVLRVRKDPATVLAVAQFAAFYTCVADFCAACERLGARPVELSEFLVAQTKLYIHALHEEAESALCTAMDADDWKRVDAPAPVQAAADALVLAGTLDPVWPQKAPVQYVLASASSASRLAVQHERFVASRSACKMALVLADLVHLACSLPPAHCPAVALVAVELLRTFNQRCHYLILSFGATRTANLKHISVKNLLLAAESLRFVHALVPCARKALERRLPDAGAYALSELDAIQQQYYDHRMEIHRKLVNLMSANVINYCKQIASTDFETATEPANRYMTELMRQTTTVANFALEMLPPAAAESLISEIYAVYKPKLLEAFSTLEVRTPAQKSNVLRDLQFFKQRSDALRGAGNTADVIYESVNTFVAPDLDLNAPAPRASPRPTTSATPVGSAKTAAVSRPVTSQLQPPPTSGAESEPEQKKTLQSSEPRDASAIPESESEASTPKPDGLEPADDARSDAASDKAGLPEAATPPASEPSMPEAEHVTQKSPADGPTESRGSDIDIAKSSPTVEKLPGTESAAPEALRPAEKDGEVQKESSSASSEPERSTKQQQMPNSSGSSPSAAAPTESGSGIESRPDATSEDRHAEIAEPRASHVSEVHPQASTVGPHDEPQAEAQMPVSAEPAVPPEQADGLVQCEDSKLDAQVDQSQDQEASELDDVLRSHAPVSAPVAEESELSAQARKQDAAQPLEPNQSPERPKPLEPDVSEETPQEHNAPKEAAATKTPLDQPEERDIAAASSAAGEAPHASPAQSPAPEDAAPASGSPSPSPSSETTPEPGPKRAKKKSKKKKRR